MTFAVLVALVVLVPIAVASATYLSHERDGRPAWGAVPLAPFEMGDGPYRRAHTVPGMMARAPRRIRLAALSCFFLGQVVVLDVLYGVLGLSIAAPGVLWIPGTLVGMAIWGVGRKLLARSAGTPKFARHTAQAAIALSLVSILSSTADLALNRGQLTEVAHLFEFPAERAAVIVLSAAAIGYAVLALLQSALLLSVTKRYAAFFPDRAGGTSRT